MPIENIAHWIYDKGHDDNIVLYSKVSIYRNIDGIRFYNYMDKFDTEKVNSILNPSIKDLNLNLISLKFIESRPLNIKILRENLILPEKRNILNSTLYMNNSGNISILINSDDHLEVQSIARGLELESCFNNAYSIENSLDKKVNFSYDKKFGFLTSSTEKLGVAMNMTVSMAIPTIMWKTPDNMDFFINKYSKLGFDLYIEDSRVPILNITNRIMLGISETDLLKQMIEIVSSISERERKLRERLKRLSKYTIEDKIFRSMGILSNCRYLKYKELLKYSLWLRVGLYYNLIENIDLNKLYYIIFITKKNHIKYIFRKNKNIVDIDEVRASIVRDIINN